MQIVNDILLKLQIKLKFFNFLSYFWLEMFF